LLLRFFFSFLVCLFTFSLAIETAKAQTSIGNTPFSRQPLGEMVPQGLSRNQAMGGTSISNLSGDFINLYNPADLFYNRNTNFETSLFGIVRNISSKEGTSQSGGLIINHVVFAFPLGKKTTMALGIMPVSFLDYSITYSSPVEFSPKDTARYNLSGTGGLSKAFLSVGRKINSKFTFGLEAGFQFGTLNYKKMYGIIGRRDEPISVISTEQKIAHLLFKPGITYRTALDTSRNAFFTAGLCYQIGNNANVKQNVLRQQVTSYFNDPYYADTLPNFNQKLRMPSMLSFGASYSKLLNFTLATQITYTDWSMYNNLSTSGSDVKSSLTAAIGAEWVPDAYSTKYYNIVALRTGFNYQSQAIAINGTQVSQWAFNIGLGLPLTRKEAKFSRPFVNLNLLAGQRGSKTNFNLEENFYAASISLILNDFQWFQRYKLQ